MSNFPSPVSPAPTSDASSADIRELLDVELLLVGGGQGEFSFN